jgi:nicotinic acid mononucleotide adenylyltransferase
MKSFRNHCLTEGIRRKVKGELVKMASTLSRSIYDQPFEEILVFAETSLLHIAHLWKNEAINPEIQIRTSLYDKPKKAIKKVQRIGFYPVAANPFHWAHFLIGLSAIAEFKLDKVIFVIAGFDPRKPDLVPMAIRHAMGKEVLKIFDPLFGYSSIAVGNNGDGESNLFRLLSLNPEQRIEAFYIAGGDHYHRINPRNNQPDTIQKMENNIMNICYRGNDNFHQVSAVFIERGERERQVNTFFPVHFLPAMLFEASSTMIREALQDNRKRETLALLPFTAYHYISKFELYAPPSHYVGAVSRNFGVPVSPVFGQT